MGLVYFILVIIAFEYCLLSVSIKAQLILLTGSSDLPVQDTATVNLERLIAQPWTTRRVGTSLSLFYSFPWL